jgi:hypothetical protein
MASCTKCGATLIAQARFCAACGSPVAHASVVPTNTPGPKSIVNAPPDPYAKTVRHDQDDADEAPVRAAVSPLAASVMATKTPVPPRPASPSRAAPAQPSPSRPAASQAPMRAPSQAPPPAPLPQAPPVHAFTPGALVLVYWADGNRYPGTVLQVSSHHVFVAFPNGMQQWIDVRYLTAGG